MAKKVRVPFRERYRTSKAIFRQSFQTFRDHPDLRFLVVRGALLFAVPMIVLMAVLFLGEAVVGIGIAMDGVANYIAFVAVFGVLMFPFMLLVGRDQMAFAFALHQRMNGRACTRRTALRRATGMLWTYARWSLVTWVVGLVIGLVGQLIDNLRWLPGLGRLIGAMGMLGWAAASFFIIPVIVVERERRITSAFGRSAAIARRQWGKSIAGIVTISLFLMVPVMLLGILLIGGVMLLLFLAPPAGLQLFLLLFGGSLFSYMAIAMALGAVSMFVQTAYQVALYHYDQTGEAPGRYGEDTLVDPWKSYLRSDT